MAGARIPGVKVEVTRNTLPVKVKSGSFSWETGKPHKSWTLDFPYPIDVSVDDVWDVNLGFAGKLWPKVTDGKILSKTRERGINTETTKISSDGGFDELQNLINYGVPWTMCFINWSWLMTVDDTARIVDGVVIGNGLGRSGTRLFHPRLPGKDIEGENVLCINGATTHKDCATYLARMIGFDLVCNTPRMEVQDTFTVPSGTTWIEAIKANFMIWNPVVQIQPAIDVNHRPTIYILDVEADDASVQSVQTLSIGNPTITNVSTVDNRSRDKIVDHLIIIGRNFQNVTNQWGEPSLIPVTLTPHTFSVDKTLTSTIYYALPLAKVAASVSGSLYGGAFGSGGTAFTPDTPAHQTISIDYHIDRTANGERWMTLAQTSSIYGVSGAKLSEQVTTNKYSASKKLIETYVDDYAKVWKYNTSTKALTSEWMWIKQKSTFQDSFLNAPDLVMTREFIAEVVVVDEKSGIYRDPKRLGDLCRNNSSRDAIDTSQTFLNMITVAKWSEISRADRETLIKRELEYDYLSGSSKFQDQPLQNPMKDRTGKPQNVPFRREYFKAGSGISLPGVAGQLTYHAAKTIKHDDIVSDDIAEQLRDREFNRFGTGVTPRNQQVTVKSPVPIPIETMALRVTLGDSSWKVDGVVTPVPGGTYFLKRLDESFSTDDKGEFHYEQVLTLVEHF